ncbi:hypothetical protein RAH32_19355 [Paracoccus sp. WLY502]|uniref:hypothetical protein n=1 Tax=Paracoccus yibinensis TaxID=3068891 RepID=UPI0027965EEF|nr:hypothetical protein [Paracoccus sp. WLY502]MDQ1902584.1 hypothetical protein [Paracoccus sp. WLY502]
MTGQAPRPGPRRLGRAGIAVVAILVALVVVIFLGRNLWHASEVTEDPPAINAGARP